MVTKDTLRAHFSSKDPVLFSYFDQVIDDVVIEKSTTPFIDLIESIISQQLSEKAASTISDRFHALFKTKKISATQILSLKDETLRGVGISWSKVSYIKSIATAVQTKALNFKTLETLHPDDIVKELTKIKGVGKWTAEMFLMFSLGHEDVFSYGDLGLRRGIMKVYGYKKDPTVNQMKKLEKQWMPYRTYASRMLWRIGDLK
ncbi:MAG: DNA-3-methyladenine glycosylase 2 family protein [Patescibacteria group bacterium]